MLLRPLCAAPDPRFGFVGTGGKAFAQKFGLAYYVLEGNYDSLSSTMSSALSANDPAPGYKVIRRVAKLNVRNDTLGQSDAQFQASLTSYAQSLVIWFAFPFGRKPVYTWYAPNAAALAAAESSQIVATLRREKVAVPAITGTVWEIGNEPDLFPALLPTQYVDIFSRYYRIIKGEDPSAQVGFGSIFLRETAERLKPKMEALLQQTLTADGLGSPGQPLFDSVYTNVRNTLESRIFNLGTLEYLSQCFAAMDASILPDIVTLHVYPYDDTTPTMDKTGVQFKLDSLLTAVEAFLNTRGLQPPVWVTEFGNINSALSVAAVASQTSDLIDIFAANAHIGNWFYYKPTGVDQPLALLPGSGEPLTRLAVDSNFKPPDGNFSCEELNAIGAMYYLRSHDQGCEENIGFSVPSAQGTAPSGPIPILVQLDQASLDTIKTAFAVRSGTAQGGGIDYSLSGGELMFAPGVIQQSIAVTLFSDSVSSGDKNFQLVLRNPVNAGLTADSLLNFTIHPANIPSKIEETGELPRAFSLRATTAGFPPVLTFAVPGKSVSDEVALTLRLFDSRGNMVATLIQGKVSPGYYRLSLGSEAGMHLSGSGLYFVEMRARAFRQALEFTWLQPD